MNWKINKVETDANNQKNITRVFFTVYTADENKVGFSGDAILSEPNDGTPVKRSGYFTSSVLFSR